MNEKLPIQQSIENKDIVRQAKEYAMQCHQQALHPFHLTPHIDHLEQSAAVAYKYLNLLKETDKTNAVAACYVHDIMQYCGKTFPEVCRAVGNDIAEIVLLNTPLRGKNRSECQSPDYFRKLNENEVALFVKLCSRIANAEAAKQNNRSIFAVYYATKREFIASTFKEEFKDMVDYYQSLFDDLDKI